ncbi:small ribosomal subunit protein mS26 [Atheta coriaria]|uniref:small ribosomal subunit protein mS26 n=1 Tax=Dalotia coriaria TaxID=877792 RepID=UPI0031F3CAD3
MLRLAQNIPKTLQITSEPLSNLQSVRWRKPRWVPIAKSKIFRIPERPVVPEIETEEMKRLNNHYRTQIKSIRRYLTKQYEQATMQTVDPEVLKKAFEEDFAKCNALNDEWNENQQKVREARYAKDLESDIKIAEQRLTERKKINQEKFMQAEEIVKSQKAIAHTFITRDNIDAAIEKAISSEIDHNFAIDLEGNKIIGRHTKPEPSKVDEKISIKQ